MLAIIVLLIWEDLLFFCFAGTPRESLEVQWLRLSSPKAGVHGFDPWSENYGIVKKKKGHWDTLRGIKANHGEKHSLRGSAPLHKPGPFSTGENLKLSGTGLNTQRSEDKIPSQHLSIPISAWESKSPLNSDENSEEKIVMDIQRWEKYIIKIKDSISQIRSDDINEQGASSPECWIVGKRDSFLFLTLGSQGGVQRKKTNPIFKAFIH